MQIPPGHFAPVTDKSLLWIAASRAEADQLESTLRAEELSCQVATFEGKDCPSVLRGQSVVYCASGDWRRVRAVTLKWMEVRQASEVQHAPSRPSKEDLEIEYFVSGLSNLGLADRSRVKTNALFYVVLFGGSAVSLLSLIQRGGHPPFAFAGLCMVAVLAFQRFGGKERPTKTTKTIATAYKRSHHALLEGDTESAMSWTMQLIDVLPREVCLHSFLNHCVEVFIHAGRYREAFELPAHWSSTAREAGRLLDAVNWALVEISLAEAEYNLGRLDDAWRRVCMVEEANMADPVVRNGVLVQKSWIETLRANATAFFLLGTIAYRAGQLKDADAHFAQGASHHYTCQGGEALLTWGDALSAFGRVDDARRAYALVLARDPQSDAAKHVRSRLKQLDERPTAR